MTSQGRPCGDIRTCPRWHQFLYFFPILIDACSIDGGLAALEMMVEGFCDYVIWTEAGSGIPQTFLPEHRHAWCAASSVGFCYRERWKKTRGSEPQPAVRAKSLRSGGRVIQAQGPTSSDPSKSILWLGANDMVKWRDGLYGGWVGPCPIRASPRAVFTLCFFSIYFLFYVSHFKFKFKEKLTFNCTSKTTSWTLYYTFYSSYIYIYIYIYIYPILFLKMLLNMHLIHTFFQEILFWMYG
jgi:hypothetical protein